MHAQCLSARLAASCRPELPRQMERRAQLCRPNQWRLLLPPPPPSSRQIWPSADKRLAAVAAALIHLFIQFVRVKYYHHQTGGISKVSSDAGRLAHGEASHRPRGWRIGSGNFARPRRPVLWAANFWSRGGISRGGARIDKQFCRQASRPVAGASSVIPGSRSNQSDCAKTADGRHQRRLKQLRFDSCEIHYARQSVRGGRLGRKAIALSALWARHCDPIASGGPI